MDWMGIILLSLIPAWFVIIGLSCFFSLRKQAKKDARNIEKLIQNDRWRQNENR